MKILYETLDSCGDIDKNRFVNENWYLMAWGMGDAKNMVLFLEGQSPVSYKILSPPRNANAIKIVLDNFITNPKCNEVMV